MKKHNTIIKYYGYLFCIAFSLISNASAAPLEVCLSAKKELDPNIQIELFTDCIYSEFQRIKKSKSPNFHYLSVGYLGRGLTYCKIGKFSLAQTDFNDSIALNPFSPESYKYRGILFKQLKEYKKAISDFNTAIEYIGASSELLIHRGSTYSEMGMVIQAIEDIEEAKTIEPNNSNIYSLLGQYYCVDKKHKKSIENFKMSIKLSPRNPSTLNNYAHCLLTNDSSNIINYQNALKWAKIAADMTGSKDPYILDTLASAYAVNGNFNEAVKKQRLALMHVESTEIDFAIEMEAALKKYKQGELYYQGND